jgi:transcriptional regulator with XRE-family HTH domain
MEKLKALRRARNLTQDELGKILGVDRSTVSQWERGENKPRVDVLIKLASVFKCSVDALLRA